MVRGTKWLKITAFSKCKTYKKQVMPELTIVKIINKAYRQVSIDKQSFDIFKQQLEILYEQISTQLTQREKLKGD